MSNRLERSDSFLMPEKMLLGAEGVRQRYLLISQAKGQEEKIYVRNNHKRISCN